jgi:hypothetical protein
LSKQQGDGYGDRDSHNKKQNYQRDEGLIKNAHGARAVSASSYPVTAGVLGDRQP